MAGRRAIHSKARWPRPIAAVMHAGCPVALSSDAHTPEHLGYEYEQALELLDGLGVKELAVFERRQVRREPIG